LNDSWERGSGGLEDDDRRTPGDLYFRTDNVFDFGLGESTRIAASPRLASARGSVLEERYHASHTHHFRFYFSDIGNTVMSGYPELKPEKNPNHTRWTNKYECNYQVTALMAEREAFDVYIVDGRYRVACACLSFLHAIKHGANLTKVRVGIHDKQFLDYKFTNCGRRPATMWFGDVYWACLYRKEGKTWRMPFGKKFHTFAVRP